MIFTALKRYYRQASVAFDYCRKKNDMMWYYTFDDIAVDYISDICCREFQPEDLCAHELIQLKEYDEKNKTESYKTLVTYILNERNTVATSGSLYVGRSTLVLPSAEDTADHRIGHRSYGPAGTEPVSQAFNLYIGKIIREYFIK